MHKAQVISLIQMKGGVGKTTCTVNLLAHSHHRHQAEPATAGDRQGDRAGGSVRPRELLAPTHGALRPGRPLRQRTRRAQRRRSRRHRAVILRAARGCLPLPLASRGVSPGGAPARISKRWKYGSSPGGGTRVLYGSQDGRCYENCAGREILRVDAHER